MAEAPSNRQCFGRRGRRQQVGIGGCKLLMQSRKGLFQNAEAAERDLQFFRNCNHVLSRNQFPLCFQADSVYVNREVSELRVFVQRWLLMS